MEGALESLCTFPKGLFLKGMVNKLKLDNLYFLYDQSRNSLIPPCIATYKGYSKISHWLAGKNKIVTIVVQCILVAITKCYLIKCQFCLVMHEQQLANMNLVIVIPISCEILGVTEAYSCDWWTCSKTQSNHVWKMLLLFQTFLINFHKFWGLVCFGQNKKKI